MPKPPQADISNAAATAAPLMFQLLRWCLATVRRRASWRVARPRVFRLSRASRMFEDAPSKGCGRRATARTGAPLRLLATKAARLNASEGGFDCARSDGG